MSAPSTIRLIDRPTYQYLRCSLVILLIALTVAVAYQTQLQGKLLPSVSAYYYTPAQSIFVGALIGLGVAMVALKGTIEVEDVALNVAGMLATVVALVPTERDKDFQDARKACGLTRNALSGGPAGAFDCPTVETLIAATRSNVQNNMAALFVAGALGLILAGVFARYRRPLRPPTTTHWWGLAIAAGIYLTALLAFTTATNWFIHHAHYIAASGLFACLIVVVLANAVRRNKDVGKDTAVRELLTPESRWYVYLAVTMTAGGVILGVLEASGTVTLFWLEALLIASFSAFWIAQTWELQGTDR